MVELAPKIAKDTAETRCPIRCSGGLVDARIATSTSRRVRLSRSFVTVILISILGFSSLKLTMISDRTDSRNVSVVVTDSCPSSRRSCPAIPKSTIEILSCISRAVLRIASHSSVGVYPVGSLSNNRIPRSFSNLEIRRNTVLPLTPSLLAAATAEPESATAIAYLKISQSMLCIIA